MKSSKVILIDDNLSLIQIVGDIFIMEGHQVTLFDSVDKAEEFFSSSVNNDRCLVLLDYMIGQQKTNQLALHIKDKCPRARIIMVSGCSPAEKKGIEPLLDNGTIFGFLEKPCKYDTVRQFLPENDADTLL